MFSNSIFHIQCDILNKSTINKKKWKYIINIVNPIMYDNDFYPEKEEKLK